MDQKQQFLEIFEETLEEATAIQQLSVADIITLAKEILNELEK